MKIGKRFNTFSMRDYKFYIDNYKKYTDFNILGIYRSICENDKLDIELKIEVRNYANHFFGKTFNFLQVKDPVTYIKLTTLGQEITWQEHDKIWDDIRINQEKILKQKRIRHRNFGTYSKHDCGHKDCPMNGVMFSKYCFLSETIMCFNTDRSKYSRKEKAERRRKERKQKFFIFEDMIPFK